MAGSIYKIIEVVGTSKSSWEDAAKYAPEEINPKKQQLAGYTRMPDEVLFDPFDGSQAPLGRAG